MKKIKSRINEKLDVAGILLTMCEARTILCKTITEQVTETFQGQIRIFYTKDPKDRHKFVISEDEAVVVRRLFRMYADGMSTVEIARIFNEEEVKPPSQVWMEKGIRKAYPKGGAFVWQHSGMLRMLKNRAYVGDLVQGVYECRKIRDDRRVTDPEKWIVTENHHEPVIDRPEMRSESAGSEYHR